MTTTLEAILNTASPFDDAFNPDILACGELAPTGGHRPLLLMVLPEAFQLLEAWS